MQWVTIIEYVYIATWVERAYKAINDCRLVYWCLARSLEDNRGPRPYKANTHAWRAQVTTELVKTIGSEPEFYQCSKADAKVFELT